jgi:hypothetical protein
MKKILLLLTGLIVVALAAAGGAQAAAGSPLGSVNTTSSYASIYGTADGGARDTPESLLLLPQPYSSFKLLVSTGYRHQKVTVKTTINCHHEYFDANHTLVNNEVSRVFTAKRRTPFTLTYAPTISGSTSCSYSVDMQRSYSARGSLVARLFGISS